MSFKRGSTVFVYCFFPHFFYFQLKDGCCSPGGTSIRGILAMEKAGVRGGIIEAVKVTTERAEELRPK